MTIFIQTANKRYSCSIIIVHTVFEKIDKLQFAIKLITPYYFFVDIFLREIILNPDNKKNVYECWVSDILTANNSQLYFLLCLETVCCIRWKFGKTIDFISGVLQPPSIHCQTFASLYIFHGRGLCGLLIHFIPTILFRSSF